jgi:hypothetical protein
MKEKQHIKFWSENLKRPAVEEPGIDESQNNSVFGLDSTGSRYCE